MIRPRTFAVGLLLAVSGVGIVGCSAATPKVVALSGAERVVMANRFANNEWANIQSQSQYPDSPRPLSGPTRLLKGLARADALLRCAEDQGLTGAVVDASGLLTVDRIGEGIASQNLGMLACRWQYPDPHSVALYFSASQLGAIYEYDRGFLQPCLVAAGIRVNPAPTREQFITQFYSSTWNPYYSNIDQQRALADKKLQKYCPPWPEWVHVPAFP